MLAGKIENKLANKNFIERFTLEDMGNVYEEFTADLCVHKAIGTLLASSDLEAFSGDDDFALDRRCGIERILSKYIESQEQVLNAFWTKASNCPEQLISQAESICNDTRIGNYRDHKLALKLISDGLSKVDAIISQFGLGEYPKAAKLQKALSKQREYYSMAIGTSMKKAV